MYKKILSLFIICSYCFLMTACGPSEEKIEQAQQKYAQLVEMHNQVVEAHKNISDASMDETLSEISGQIAGFEEFNLAEMKDEEIDALIQSMDVLITSYENALKEITDIKAKEDAAVLTSIPVSVENGTSFTFTSLKLYETGDYDTHVNVLEETGGFLPGQAVTGLMIERDVDNTSWMLTLADTEGAEYEYELKVSEYDETGITLKLSYDVEEKKLSIEEIPKADKSAGEDNAAHDAES
ncbi:MAG: hypothetical protein ACI4ER_02075 [Suilimivivens sp.]